MGKIETETKTKKYGPPKVPSTPSGAINSMLQTRCGKTYNNPLRAAIAYYICWVFHAITVIYEYIYTNKAKPSHTFWMISCGIVSVGLVMKCYIAYHMLIISAIVLHSVLYYFAILLALAGIGLGLSGVLFFDKEASKSGVAFRSQSYLVTDTSKTDSKSTAHGAGDMGRSYKAD